MRQRSWKVQFRLRARIDEDKRGSRLLDRRQHIRHRVAREMARPRHIGVRREDGYLRLRTGAAAHQFAAAKKIQQRLGIGDRRGQVRRCDGPARASAIARDPAPADRHAWNCAARAIRPARPPSDRRTGAAPRARRSAAPTAPAWSAGCPAAASSGAGAARPAYRRCAFRRGWEAPSPQSAPRDCARRRPQAPSAARCRACAARGRASTCRACAAALRARSIRLGRNPASVLPPPVGATSSTDSPRAACSTSAS